MPSRHNDIIDLCFYILIKKFMFKNFYSIINLPFFLNLQNKSEIFLRFRNFLNTSSSMEK